MLGVVRVAKDVPPGVAADVVSAKIEQVTVVLRMWITQVPWVLPRGGSKCLKLGIICGITRVNEFIVPVDGVKILIFLIATFMPDPKVVTAVVIASKIS